MGKQYSELPDKLIQFIKAQHIFFTGTATADSRINISPKGMDSLRVIDKSRLIWLNVTGSGNETAAHVQLDPRMTIMFAAVEGDPMILRVYGQARVVHKNDKEWAELFPLFSPLPGARQIFDLSIELVQSSCGMGVALFDYVGERDQLVDWTNKKGEQGIEEYWRQKNQTSIDGLPTHIVKKNT